MRRFNILHVHGDRPDCYPVFIDIKNMIQLALSEMGYEVNIIYSVDEATEDTIVLGGNLLNHAEMKKLSRCIVYNFEQAYSPWFDNPAYIDLLRSNHVLDYSIFNVRVLEGLGCAPVLCEVAYSQALVTVPSLPEDQKDIDVLFFGSKNERRHRVFEAIEKELGVKVEYVFKTDNKTRDAMTARAKIMICPHYYESKIFPTLRIVPVLCNGGFVLVESGTDIYLDNKYKGSVGFTEYDSFAESVDFCLKHPEHRTQIASRGQSMIRETSFKYNLQNALAQLSYL